MHRDVRVREPGPFTADQLRPGDRYELSNGHAIWCAPTGGSGARSAIAAGQVIDSDPAVQSAGIDAGFTTGPKQLRAPDVSVGVPDEAGWISGVPPLAIEIADRGQDEAELRAKVTELLAAGTRLIWVVRMRPPRHVEIHEPGKPRRTAGVGDLLHAPGILQNPVPVESLWDREVAHDVTLRNLLQRRGFDSLEAVAAQGREELLGTLRERAWTALASRGAPESARAVVFATTAPDMLIDWIAGGPPPATP